MGFLQKTKRFHVKRWYCRVCDRRTNIEVNPEWETAGKPLSWEGPKPWTWFTRCSACKTPHYNDPYGCPNCGCPFEPAGELYSTFIKSTKAKRNPRYSFDFGVEGYDWEEQHKCRKCGRKVWISNASC